MILKASQRGGGMQLAAHLLKSENEHVEVHEVRGFVSNDLKGAMKEAQAVAMGTRCKQHLFSVSLNPPAYENVGVAAFEAALDRIEQSTGLTGQPRMVVFHEKEGRRHCHAVWSRIDADTMTARPMSHFKMKLREVSKGLYLEHGWQMPRGFMDSKERDPRNFTLSEWQQAKRMGRDPKALKATIQECWTISNGRPAFEKALEERGLYLARGDRRAHVAVTYEGEVLSIARLIGKRTKEVTAKLGPPDTARSVADAKSRIAETIAPRLEALIKDADRNRMADLAPLHERRHAMKLGHKVERQRLDEGQKARAALENKQRSARLRAGVVGIWDRLTGRHASTVKQNDAETLASIRRDRSQRDALVSGQLDDRRGLQRDILAVRHRHAAKVLELHRDLARQTGNPEPGRENLRDSFAGAAKGDVSPSSTAAPRRILRGRGRDSGRDGPDIG